MKLPTVQYTKIRGRTYHFNIPIAEEIRRFYLSERTGKPKKIFDGTMKTSDPAVARNMVADEQSTMRKHLKAVVHKADQERIAATLDAADAVLLAEHGGVVGLLKSIKDNRRAATFVFAGQSANFPDPDEIDHEGGEWVDPLDAATHLKARETEGQELQARLDYIAADTRRLKGIAMELGADVPTAPEWINEGQTGIRELAEAFMDENNYSVQMRESMNNTVRRWLEMHGDLPIEKWKRRHLNEFDQILRSFPSSSRADVRGLPIRKAVEKGKQDGLAAIVRKTRKRYVTDMKALTKFAVNSNGTLEADHFAGYEAIAEKVKHSDAKKAKRKSYTPEQVGRILDFCTTEFDRQDMSFWMPLIAAFTGARMEEIGQLRVGNVRVVGNMHVIDITDEEADQTVKNQYSVRSIPLPKPILAAGFVEYVQERRQAGATMLFRELKENNQTKIKRFEEVKPNKLGHFTAGYGRNFPRTVRNKLGLIEDGMVFHSLRHSWTDAARRAKIDPELRRKIAGRSENEDPVEGGYRQEYDKPMQRLYQVVWRSRSP